MLNIYMTLWSLISEQEKFEVTLSLLTSEVQ
jgi:hypothetical protein